ncbi:MAG: Dabb family protein [Marmoricola sp.]
MIHNVVLGRLHPDADRERMAAALRAVEALDLEGTLWIRAGLDAGLREGGWDYAITGDFVDAAAYRRYDADEEHNRLRREEFVPLSAEIARVQLEL